MSSSVTIRRRFVDVDYGQLHLREAGLQHSDRAPLICLHQCSKSGREFANFLTAAAAHRPVIAPDYPGYGESDHAPESPAVTISDYARTIWQAIDVLVAEALLPRRPVDLFGNHTGSEVSVEMARQRPDQVRHIAMVSAPVLTAQEVADFLQRFQPVAMDETGGRFEHIWNSIVQHRAPGMTLEMMGTSFAETLRGGEAYEWGHIAAFNYAEQFAEAIQHLPQRVVVLNPADLLHDITLRVAPLLRNGEVIECPQWQHEVVNIHAAAVCELVLQRFAATTTGEITND